MKNFKKLSKNEMKVIIGGNYYLEEIESGGGSGCYSCCTDTSCSLCLCVDPSNISCTGTGVLTSCPG